jgi:hypothetical protein
MPASASENPARLQELIDQAALFHLFIGGAASPDHAVTRDHGGSVIGIDSEQEFYPFEIELGRGPDGCPFGQNVIGARIGQVSQRWAIVPEEFVAHPDRQPPPTRLDPTRSQRFVIQEATFTFDDGRDGFTVFGAGRTFPMPGSRREDLWAAAVANIVDGFGAFRGREGNITICGDLSPGQGFVGHVIVRVLDHDQTLRAATTGTLPTGRTRRADPAVTYLTWIAQKSSESGEQENTPSFTPEGEMRGLNIPVDLKRVSVGLAGTSGGVRVREMRTADVIGLEVGFGRESVRRTSMSGTALLPNRFEGVSEYRFYGPSRRLIGTLTANVLEGRSFAVRLPSAPAEPALRFGFFGPVVHSSGCFAGARGFLYGAAGSVFGPPPYPHRISNLYVLRLEDRNGHFRGA